jgi:hypothetical protein
VRSLLPPARAADHPAPSSTTVTGTGREPDALEPLWVRRLSWVGLAIVLLPLVVGGVTAVQELDGSYYAAGDLAAIELKTHDVLRHPVLTGLFSRDGWDHPGPAMFYVLAGPYRLLGSHTWGLHVGVLLVNGACIVGMALIARRRGGVPLFLLTLIGLGLLVQGLGPDFIRDPWNPWLPVLPFGLLVFLTWEMTCGATWALPVAAAVSTFCVQTHIGYGLLAVPLLLWGAGALLLRWRRSGAPDRRQLAGAGAIAALVLAVLWLPPLIEQVTDGQRGNLQEITSYFRNDDGQEKHSAVEGLRLLSSQLGWHPQWVSGWPDFDFLSGEPDVLQRAASPVLLVPLVAGLVLLWVLRVRNSRSFVALSGLLVAVGILWVTRTLGPVFTYRVMWEAVVGMVLSIGAAWGVWALLVRSLGRGASQVLAALALAVLVVVTVPNVGRATEQPITSFTDRWDDALAAMVPEVLDGLPDREGDVILRCDQDEGCIVLAGLFLELEERGLRPRVESEGGVVSSNAEHRVHHGGPVRAVLHIGVQESFDDVMEREGARLIAYDGRLPPRAAARAAAEIERVDARYERGEIDEVERYLRRTELSGRLRKPIGIFLEPQ